MPARGGLKPIRRTNLSQSIVDQVIDLISRGVYKPGDKLPTERELTEMLGVGRSSIREAFQALAMMGVIEIRPSQGTFVKGPTPGLLIHPNILSPLTDRQVTEDLLEARTVLEPIVAALAAERASEADIAEMQDHLDRCRQALASREPVYELSAGFHLLVARASHNAVFESFIRPIMGLLAARGARIEGHEGFNRWELASHWEICGAIAARDPARAKAAMKEHLKRSADAYLALDTAAQPEPDHPAQPHRRPDPDGRPEPHSRPEPHDRPEQQKGDA